MTDNAEKIILDLCGGTGAWSKPYREAGYDVRVITHPYDDVLTFEPPKGVYGILAAPTCTMFSLARTTAKTPRDLEGGFKLVHRCLDTDLWGYYNEPRKKIYKLTDEEKFKCSISNRDLPELPKDYVLPNNFKAQAARRSITDEHFAKAFFKANK